MSKIKKVKFFNRDGFELSARLELPIDQHPKTFALFAHCFTCSKNARAARSISQCLTKRGIGVLRFDFTGLGDSEGDFSDTNFSSNVEDLVDAVTYLESNYEAPSLLIGHSFGGAAALFAAGQLDSIKAVVTIGAPAEPEHVTHLVVSGKEEIEKTGTAEVNIGGRPFTIKRQFLEDLSRQSLKEISRNLKKALLIFHSPQDRIVSIDNAEKIYLAARHPKSFVTLDGSDHMLSKREDGYYVGEVIASWLIRYVEIEDKKALETSSQVAVRLNEADDFTTEIKSGKHWMIADEPESVGGNDFGPSPYELVSAGLGACTVMTMHMYARRKKWDLQEVTVHIDHHKSYVEDMQHSEDKKSRIDHFDRDIEMEGNLDEAQRARLLEIADRCPVHRTLHSDVVIRTKEKVF